MSANTLDTTKYNTVAANTVLDAVIDPVSILAWRENVKTVVNQHATEINLKANKTQEAWIAPTLLNAWVNVGGGNSTAGYMKDEFGFVHLKGLISGGSTASFSDIFLIPIVYRPLEHRSFPATCSTGDAKVIVASVGNVQFVSGSNTNFSLDGITFRAEQ